MQNTTENSLKQMLGFIERMKAYQTELAEFEKEIEHLKQHSSVGDLLNFPNSMRRLVNNGVLKYTLSELDNFISMKEDVEILIAQAQAVENSDIEYKAGEILVTKFVIHAKQKGHHYVLEQSGFEQYGKNQEFLILDNLDNQNFVLIVNNTYGYGDQMLFANRSQLDVLMEKKNTVAKDSFIKMEFSISGPDPIKYAKTLTKMKLFEKPCCERIKSEYEYDQFSTHSSNFITVTGDEIFGIMGAAYFQGQMKSDYSSIITIWTELDTGSKNRKGSKYDANKIGFHKKDRETYKYDSNISYFVPNNYPKDVFTSKGTKDKLINILELTQIIDTNKLLAEQAITEYAQV